MPKQSDIEIVFDEESQSYYIIWEPIIIGAGKTKKEVLADLRQAAHFGVDTIIDTKIKDIGNRKEN